MDNTNTNFRQILVRKPFYELTPKNYMTHGIMREQELSENVNCYMPDDTLYRRIKTQHDFLREFYPSSHKIWDKNLYPDIYRKILRMASGTFRKSRERRLPSNASSTLSTRCTSRVTTSSLSSPLLKTRRTSSCKSSLTRSRRSGT